MVVRLSDCSRLRILRSMASSGVHWDKLGYLGFGLVIYPNFGGYVAKI